MKRFAYFLYGVVCYAIFFASLLYTIGFLANVVVPKTIDSGTAGPVGQAVLINLLLIGLFGIQHSVMARPAFKTWWTKIVPEPLERATYVLASSLLLFLLFWQWRPMPTAIWRLDDSAAGMALTVLLFVGFLLVLVATFLIDHFDLFGLRQVYLHLQGKEYTHKPFKVPVLYNLVRHPLYLGWLIAFWATPVMTHGHLLFAIVASAYIFVAIPLEERDLLAFLGDDYRRYRERTPMIIPLPWKR